MTQLKQKDLFYRGYGWEILSILFPFIGPLYLALDKRGSMRRRGLLGSILSLIILLFLSMDIYRQEPDQTIILNLKKENEELMEINDELRAKLEALYKSDTPVEEPKAEPGLISININGTNYDTKNATWGEYNGLHQVVFKHSGHLNNIRFKTNGTFTSIQQDNTTLRSNVINARIKKLSNNRMALIWRFPSHQRDSTIIIRE